MITDKRISVEQLLKLLSKEKFRQFYETDLESHIVTGLPTEYEILEKLSEMVEENRLFIKETQ